MWKPPFELKTVCIYKIKYYKMCYKDSRFYADFQTKTRRQAAPMVAPSTAFFAGQQTKTAVSGTTYPVAI